MLIPDMFNIFFLVEYFVFLIYSDTKWTEKRKVLGTLSLTTR